MAPTLISRAVQLDMRYSPTLRTFLQCEDQYCFLIGPVGSGKSVASLVKPYYWALAQEPNEQNVRPFKAGIVRNTMPELWRTTIETYISIFGKLAEPKGEWENAQDLRRSSPVSHDISWKAEGQKSGMLVEQTDEFGFGLHWRTYDGSLPGLDYHIDFFALDRPQHVKELLSYECSYLFFNEAREIPKAIIDAAGDRVGRYPSLANGGVRPTKSGVAGDTNPPDEDHWMYEFYSHTPKGWKFFKQSSGLSEVVKNENGLYISMPGEPDVGEIDEDLTTEWDGRRYAVNPNAENLPNLPLDRRIDPKLRIRGRGNYYLSRVSGKDYSWIQSYYKAKFVYVREGKPVIPEFETETMVVDDLPIIPGYEIEGGFDVGGGTLNPAGIIGQRGPRGIYLIHAEISVSDTGISVFGEEFKRLLQEQFLMVRTPDGEEIPLKIGMFYGDPAGKQRDQIFEQVVFDHLKAQGIPVKAAPTNDPQTRIDATKAPMMRYIDRKPGILINRHRCPKLIKGLAGEWKFRRIQVAGKEKYGEKPDKNPYSHVCDALGYYLSGKGEVKALRGKDRKPGNDYDLEEPYDYWNERGK